MSGHDYDKTVTREDLALLARWLDAEGGTLAEFVDCIERPDRWRSEIRAARALFDALTESEKS